MAEQLDIKALSAERQLVWVDTLEVVAHTKDGRAVLRLVGKGGDVFLSVSAAALGALLTSVLLDAAGALGSDLAAAVREASGG